MFTIRPFEKTDTDYAAIVDVANAAWPDEPTTVEIRKHNDNDWDEKYFHQRFVVETSDGRLVAEGGAWESPWAYVAGKYSINFEIHPDFEGQGIDAQLYQHLMKTIADRDPKPTLLKMDTRANKTSRMKFYEDQGFEIVMRENMSRLIVTDYDYAPFDGVTEIVQDSGIVLLTLPELQARDSDWMRKFYDLGNEIEKDIPAKDAPTPEPIEQFAKMFKHPCWLPKANFIAVDGDQWVGLSNLWKDDARTDRLWVGLTGILRSHRRRSIATALKLLTFKYAQTYGATCIETGNEENNPMYDLNVRLGFKLIPGWLEYRKNL